MAAIITDQLRILNTKDFVASVASTTNSYYTWIGLPNPTQVLLMICIEMILLRLI